MCEAMQSPPQLLERAVSYSTPGENCMRRACEPIQAIDQKVIMQRGA